jgi:hypothetical protein
VTPFVRLNGVHIKACPLTDNNPNGQGFRLTFPLSAGACPYGHMQHSAGASSIGKGWFSRVLNPVSEVLLPIFVDNSIIFTPFMTMFT